MSINSILQLAGFNFNYNIILTFYSALKKAHAYII